MPTTTEPLEQHFLRERDRLLAFIRGKLDDPDLAEDVLQESLVRALRSAHDLLDEEKLTSWLYQIVRNAITDTYRRRATARGALDRYTTQMDETGAHVLTPEDVAQLCACLLDIVPTMKPEYAAVIEADLVERDSETLAERLGITRNNLKVRRHRAHQQLRERLEQVCRVCATHGCLDCSCKAGT